MSATILPKTQAPTAKPAEAAKPNGLSKAEAERRLKSVGANAMPDTAVHPLQSAFGKLWAPVPWMLATIGDMPNDVLMFRKSGFSIAMGNASDDVKAQASAVTASNEDEGFASGMRQFLLSPTSAQHPL